MAGEWYAKIPMSGYSRKTPLSAELDHTERKACRQFLGIFSNFPGISGFFLENFGDFTEFSGIFRV